MAHTYIIFCYIQELSEFYFLYNQQLSSEFYFLYNQQPTTINGLYLIYQRDIKLDLKYLGDMLYRLKKS